MPKKIFFSYSHKDETLRNHLEVQLAQLKNQGIVESWHDRSIIAGSPVDKTISEQLEESDIILLLVSSDFLASEYCYGKEMGRALERHKAEEALVIPVILRPCDWKYAPFGNFLATPKDGKAVTTWPNMDEAFLDVVSYIRNAIGEMTGDSLDTLATTDLPPEPSAQVVYSSYGPQSRNLHMRKTFTDIDKDSFLEESFEYMARFFENSLTKLSSQNPGIQGRFNRIDSQHFSGAVYRNGGVLSRCWIWYGGSRFSTDGIAYSENNYGDYNSYNELLWVVETDQELFLRPFGLALMWAEDTEYLTKDRAAEVYWNLLVKPLLY